MPGDFKQNPIKKIVSIPFDFVLDRLDGSSPIVRPMFGCHAIYLGEKIVLILRSKDDDSKYDNGVWVATTEEHHFSLKKIFPSMRPIRIFGGKTSAWQNIPADADDFEESVITACEMVLKNDPRIGKIPGGKKKKNIRKR
jgi:hypothetical protein